MSTQRNEAGNEKALIVEQYNLEAEMLAIKKRKRKVVDVNGKDNK